MSYEAYVVVVIITGLRFYWVPFARRRSAPIGQF